MPDDPLPTVRYVLLALVAREPATGQELANQLRKTVGFFWSAPHSQIYPQLSALAADGLVSYDIESAGDVRPRKRYRPTPAGLRVLRRWLVTPPERAPERDEVMVRAFATSLADPQQAIAMYRDLAQVADERLAQYEGFVRDLQEEFPDTYNDPTTPVFGNWATLRAGLIAERGRGDWARWMIEQLTGR